MCLREHGSGDRQGGDSLITQLTSFTQQCGLPEYFMVLVTSRKPRIIDDIALRIAQILEFLLDAVSNMSPMGRVSHRLWKRGNGGIQYSHKGPVMV